MYQICHASLSSHRFEHIPESNVVICRQVLLVTHQIFNTGHCAQGTIFRLIVPVTHANYQNTCLWKCVLQMINGGLHTCNVFVIIPSTFSSNVQSVLQDNQVIRTLLIKFMHHPYRNGAQRQARTATQREVIQNNSFFAIHSQTIE